MEPQEPHLAGAVAVVTGGAGGIGAAITSEFLGSGAEKVFVVDRDERTTAAFIDGLDADHVRKVHVITIDLEHEGASQDDRGHRARRDEPSGCPRQQRRPNRDLAGSKDQRRHPR